MPSPTRTATYDYVIVGAGSAGCMLANRLSADREATVLLRSADPFEHPAIDPRYLTAKTDLDALVEGVKRCREVARAPPFDEYRGEEVLPGADAASDEAIAEHVRETASTVYRPVGTCRMGNDEGAVVDDRLRVHDIGGLRIVDASIMPRLVGGNTNAPTIAIAERAAALIRDEWDGASIRLDEKTPA